MVSIGYGLLSEEHSAPTLVANARRAEEAGFGFALISDHFHPWIDAQGESPFVWSTLGAIAQATERLVVGTGVTCPTIRTHPAIIAQAAATTATLMPDRFFLGVGSGENLNEHILGDYWPPALERLEMLEEAMEVIRYLWQGGLRSYEGNHYKVEQARIYSLPETLPPIIVAAGGPHAARLAARAGDGLIAVNPDAELVEIYRRERAGPRIGMIHLCWAESSDDAIETVMRQWPNAGLPGQIAQELRLPSHFQSATALVRSEDIAAQVPCGPNPTQLLEAIEAFKEAGFDHIILHQIGPDQEGFFSFFERELRDAVQPDPVRPEQLAMAS